MTENPFRIAFVAGVTPDKWVRTWEQRRPGEPIALRLVEEADQIAVLHDGTADMTFARLPVDRDGLHVIPLYHEVSVVVLAKDHLLAELDSVKLEDLAEEHLLQAPDDVPGWADVAHEVRDGTRLVLPRMSTRQAVEAAAAGTGVLIVPMSVARVHDRKDVTALPVTDLPETRIGLAWRTDSDDPRAEEFIGIVRGRTARSSRGGPQATTEQPPGQQRARSRPRKPRR